MDDTERRKQIVEQLTNAGKAHFEYETDTLQGVYDENWASWYAGYLLERGWRELFTRAWSAADLAAALQQLDQEYRAQSSQTSWQEYYAERLAQL